jgi:DNA-binding PadR family transcriptional regulator
MLKFAILELLHRKPLSGYQLKRRFQGSIVFFWRANHSQIYLELNRMEKAGLVLSNQVPQDGRPTKKVYAVTDKGLQALVQWLREAPKLQSVKDEMLLKCFAFNLIEPDEAAAQLVHHRKLHEERMSHYREIKRQLDARHGDPLETSDPILFWNFLCLRQAIAFERMYIGWCEWALARQRDFTGKQRSTSRAAAQRAAGEDAAEEQLAGEEADGRLAN